MQSFDKMVYAKSRGKNIHSEHNILGKGGYFPVPG